MTTSTIVEQLSLDLIWGLKVVGDIAMAPDGRSVAVVISEFDRTQDVVLSSLWIYPTDNSPARCLIPQGSAGLSSPAWSADGSALALLADGDIVVARPVGEAAVERFNIGLVAEEFAWFPDGASLCLVARPAPSVDDSGAVVIDVLRHKTREDGWFDGRYRCLWLLDLKTRSIQQLTDGSSTERNPAISPSGDLIAFTSDRSGDPDHDRPIDIWLLSVDGKQSMRRMTDSDGEYTLPSFAPSGETIAFLGHRGALGDESANVHVWSSQVADGPPVDLLGEWDGTAADVLLTETRAHAPGRSPVWSADSRALSFIGSLRGSSNVFQVTSDGGVPVALTTGDHELAEVSFAKDGDQFAVLRTATSEPPDVWIGAKADGLSRLTAVNSSTLEGIQFMDHERVRFPGEGGREIEGFIVRPPGFSAERRYPLIVRIAGGPHLAYGSSFVDEVQVMAARGYVVFYCNPRGTQSYGQEHARAVVGDWCGKDGIDILAGVQHVVSLGFTDETKIGLTGASYGGLMVNWLVTQTDRFAVAVAQRSISNLYSFVGAADRQNGAFEFEFDGVSPYEHPAAFLERSPLWHVRNVHTPLLLIQAGNDHVTPVSQAEEFHVALKRLGRTSRLIVYPDEQHYVRRYGRPSSRMHYMQSHLNWLDQYLQPGTATTSP